jgi:2-(1,2-epoxy-1,2-dihydrophenyl)acetyl-CoA isomerase
LIVTDTEATQILVQRDGPVARVVLNRPEHRNSVTATMFREVHAALETIAVDRSITVVALTGAGHVFSPGAGLGGDASTEGEVDLPEAYQYRSPVLLHEMPQVSVALLNGSCAGPALGWACACDLRLATASARFNTAFLDVGVAGEFGLPWTLPRIVGAGRARDLCFLPRKFDAAEALQIGLVDRVFDPATFAEEAEAVLQRLASFSPPALRALKSNFVAAERTSFADFIDLESERHLHISTSPEGRARLGARRDRK